MLTATSTRQVHKAVTVVPTSVTQAILNLNYVLLLEQTCRGILQFPDLEDCLLGTRSSHGDLSSAHGRLTHATSLAETHLLTVGRFLVSDRHLELLFGDSDTVSAEAIVDGVVLDNGPVEGEQVQPPC